MGNTQKGKKENNGIVCFQGMGRTEVERTEKIGKLGSVLYYTILTSGIILTFHTFKEEINDDAGGGGACRGGVTHSCISNNFPEGTGYANKF